MKALLLVDIQRDFLPGGSLAVSEGDQVVPVANKLVPHFDLVVATQDWHPAHHGSFAANHPGRQPGEVIELNGLQQTLWPTHCVRDTEGAQFAEGLDTSRTEHVVQKGTDPGIDSYSAFYDNGHQRPTGLTDFLRIKNVDVLYVLGLAADVCVKYTVLDARREGFEVCVVTDGTRGVNLRSDDTQRAFNEMEQAGAKLIRSDEVLAATV